MFAKAIKQWDQCPNCGYPQSGLSPDGMTCPECGLSVGSGTVAVLVREKLHRTLFAVAGLGISPVLYFASSQPGQYAWMQLVFYVWTMVVLYGIVSALQTSDSLWVLTRGAVVRVRHGVAEELIQTGAIRCVRFSHMWSSSITICGASDSESRRTIHIWLGSRRACDMFKEAIDVECSRLRMA